MPRTLRTPYDRKPDAIPCRGGNDPPKDFAEHRGYGCNVPAVGRHEYAALPGADLVAALDAAEDGWGIAVAVRADGSGSSPIVDFRLVYLNEAGAQALGRSRDELVGGVYSALWPNL